MFNWKMGEPHSDTNPIPVRILETVAGAGGATDAAIQALSAQFPASLGPKPSVNSLSVTFSTDIATLTVKRPKLTVTNTGSGTIVATGTTAVVNLTDTSRTEIINPSSNTLWASYSVPSVGGAGSFPIFPNGSYAPPENVSGIITLLSTTNNQTYTVHRFS